MLSVNFCGSPGHRQLMDILIREASLQDLDTIVRFNAAMARETEDKELPASIVTQGVRRVLSDPGCGQYFIAVAHEEVVGQLMFTLEWSDWRNGWFWWIQSVYVAPDWRGKRVFSTLYKHLEVLARADKEVCGLRLYVNAGNTSAQATYHSLGMESTDYRVMEAVFDSGDSANA